MSTTLYEAKDEYGVILEVYDSSAGLTIFVHKDGEDKGLKFNVTEEEADGIDSAFIISSHLEDYDGRWR